MDISTKDAEVLQRLILAGMRLMYDKQSFPLFMQGAKSNMPMPQKLATQVGGLMQVLADRYKGEFPKQLAAPAGAMLVIEMAKFMQEAGIAKPTQAEVQAAIQTLMAMLLHLFQKQPQPQAGMVAQGA